MALKLDETRPHGIAFVGDESFIGQDGKYFDRLTKEEVTPKVTIPKSGFVCKFCGAVRQNAEMLREHLVAAHPENVPELMPKKTEPTPEKTKGKNR